MVRSFPMAAASAVVASVVLVATGGAAAASPASAHGQSGAQGDQGPLGHYKHLVVIYEENHSFDNLYGLWGSVNGQSVNGLAANPADTPNAAQVREDGTQYNCLYQDDPALSTPPQDAACGGDHGSNGFTYDSHFTNAPFDINNYITPQSNTCQDPVTKAPAPGGCTRDLVHRFYQEQYQLDGGAMDRYTTGSDAVGLTQGYYDTTQLPVYQYLHGEGAPKYVVADNFFQAAFGGSFLNHQYLVAAQAPVWPNAPAAKHSVVDANGMPNNYPLYTSPLGTAVKDQPVTQACGQPTTQPAFACGDFAVNTVQPAYQPSAGGTSTLPAINDVDPNGPNYEPNIGDRLSAAGVPWAWYSGGWDAANSGHPDPLFQYHHQPFNYFQAYAPGTAARAEHLKDETEFMSAARAGTLPAVSFVKPAGAENEHPGYASTDNGEQHLVDLLRSIEEGDSAGDTLVVVTYDEFGGAWDHVPPPGQGTQGVSDAFGPGTRIPALVIGRSLPRSGVDHTVYDTTSILATIEHEYGLEPLMERDARVSDLGPALAAAGVKHTTG